MSQIDRVHARQILDSRGNPTVEVEVALRSGAARARGRALGRLDRRVRGDRAARRRRARGSARASRRRSRTSTARSREAIAGLRRHRPARPRPRALRARRHAEQVAARRQRDPRRLARGRARGRGGGGPAALALPRRRGRARAARADDERPQRRRARRQQGRLPGVHDRALRRADVRRGRCGWAPRSSTRSRSTLHERGLATAVGDEGGFAPDLGSNEEALQMLDRRASRRPATGPARTSRSRSTRRRARSSRTARTSSSTRAARCRREEMAGYWAEMAGRYPIVSIEDGMAEEDWDGLAGADRAARRAASSSSATTSS